jgi:hypothetical protein
MVVHTEADLLAGVLHPAFLSSQVQYSSHPSQPSGQFLKTHKWTRFNGMAKLVFPSKPNWKIKHFLKVFYLLGKRLLATPSLLSLIY